MATSDAPGRSKLVWTLAASFSIVALVVTALSLTVPLRYHFDAHIYQMGARAWLAGHHLYGDTLFSTWIDGDLEPFTYPPVAAVLFSPLAWLPVLHAGTVLTVVSTLSLFASIAILLNSLAAGAATGPEPVWRRAGLAAAISVAVIWLDLEPVASTIDLGQINLALMALVLADCLPQRTFWPRGLLVGVAIAVKLTPAVFLLYFLLRRDFRGVGVAAAGFATATMVGFVLAASDSVEYWFGTVGDTGRIGPAGRNANQNVAGLLVRAGLDGTAHFVAWATAGVAVLVLTVWAARRALNSGQPQLALIAVALFGLVVSPVSWSHHWVWFVPAIVTLLVVGVRRRSTPLVLAGVAGVAITYWHPLSLMNDGSGLWIQFVGTAYVWWALAVIATVGLTCAARAASPRRSPEYVPPAKSLRT
jgi:alpha-1,2-mannosyltransferase